MDDIGAPGGISDEDAVLLPSVFRVAAAASAAVTAAHREAAAFLGARNGAAAPAVSVDARAAVAAFRSERYLRLDGSARALWEPLSGDYQAADGWIRLHCNFTHHAEIACRVLGVSADRDAVAAAVAGRDKYELEDAITAAGGVAAAMRTREEWAAHPQSRAVARQPLVAFEPSGSAAADEAASALLSGGMAESVVGPVEVSKRWPSAERPLAGVRVLDLTRIIAGPVAGRVLAGYGAEVTMVRSPHLPTIEMLDLDTSFGKHLRHLDLRLPEDHAAFLDVVRESDVVLQSYRPGALEALGLGPQDLGAVRPGLVYVSVSAYGTEGPWAGKRGFDSLVQMVTGIADEGTRAAGTDRPVPLPAQVLDHAAGWYAAAGAIAALRNGVPGTVSVTLARMARWLDELGRVDPERALATPDQTLADITDLLLETPSAAGTLNHVRFPGAIDSVPLGWDCPPPPALVTGV